MNLVAIQSSGPVKHAIRLLAVALVTVAAIAAVSLLLLIGDPKDGIESMNESLTSVSRQSTALTNQYLVNAEESGAVSALSVARSAGSFDDGLVLNTLENVVAEHDNVDGAYVGLPNGDFISVINTPSTLDDNYRITFIENADGPDRLVTRQQTNNFFEPFEEVELVDEPYDPRVRPWYQAALESERGWTDIFNFASSGLPGITHFRSVLTADGEVMAVVGIDVQLSEISNFLQDRRPSENGFATIVSDDGAIISGQPNELNEEFIGQLADQSRGLDPTDILLTDLSTGAGDNIAALARVGSDSDWTLIVSAPQSDFLSRLDRQAGRIRDLIILGWVIATLSVVAAAIWTLRRIDRLHDHATTDPLTGLLNRAEVRIRFGELLDDSPNQLIAAIAIDFDDFREINNIWGHLVGDEALVVLTRRLTAGIGDAGFAGRLGGDEFLVAWAMDSEANALAEVTQLVDSVSHPEISIEGATVRLSVSCGFALRKPGEEIGLVTLLRNADLALLAAKSQSQNVVRFDPEMVLPSISDNEREAELRGAVERDEFEIHFQPEVDITGGAVIGAEALLRWRLGDGSFMPAKDFIDDLERLNVLDMLTPQLLAQAERLAERISDPDFTVRLNFGGDQIRNIGTLEAIAAAHQRTNVGWCLEITERTIVESDAPMLRSLEELVQKGVTLALDDFGTGYSSLAELRNLPISTVKIDRSFIKTLTVQNAKTSLVSIIHDLAQRLSLEVIAEGIETEEQRQALSLIGCRQGQGWLFGAAMPIEEFVTHSSLSVGEPA